MAWAQMIEAWQARLAGDSPDAESRFEAAKALAAVRGVRFMPAAHVAKLPREELLQRSEAVQTPQTAPPNHPRHPNSTIALSALQPDTSQIAVGGGQKASRNAAITGLTSSRKRL